MAATYELRIFIDDLDGDVKRRLKLLYSEISKQELGGPVPIFWPGDDVLYDENNPRNRNHPEYSNVPLNNTIKSNHKIRCVMIQINFDGSEKRVPFTISELNNVCETHIYPQEGQLYVPSQQQQCWHKLSDYALYN